MERRGRKTEFIQAEKYKEIMGGERGGEIKTYRQMEREERAKTKRGN